MQGLNVIMKVQRQHEVENATWQALSKGQFTMIMPICVVNSQANYCVTPARGRKLPALAGEGGGSSVCIF